MKREEYYVDYGMDVLSINDRIDKIFDDVESRICENCKHLYVPKAEYLSDKSCNIGVAGNTNNNSVWNSFGCNKFERKQNH